MRDHPKEEEDVEEGPVRDGVHRSEVLMIHELMVLQEKRCIAFNTLQRCMKEFRESKQMCVFAGTMREITHTFQTVSCDIIQLGKDFEASGYHQSAQMVDKLQDMEQLKLKLTAEAHIKQQAVSTHGRDEDREELKEVKTQHGKLILEINELLSDLRYQGIPPP